MNKAFAKETIQKVKSIKRPITTKKCNKNKRAVFNQESK